MARWDEQRSAAKPAAPVLLFPIEMHARGTAAEDFEIQVVDDPEVNPTLLHKVTTDFRCEASSEQFEDLIDANSPELVAQVFERFKKLADEVVPGFAIDDVLIVGNFSYFKLPMVRDIERFEAELIEHDVIAALAGDEGARDSLRRINAVEVDESLPDFQPPADEFLIRDADATQSHAINRVVAGANLVVKGPPGTGKSQTIANLIATLSARGFAILFVAEKRAAIDAVTKRLDEVGLSNLVMDLHRRSGSRRQVAEDLRRTLDEAAATPLPDHDESHDVLVARRQILSNYAHGLHSRREPWGISLYEANAVIIGTPPGARCDYRFDQASLRRLDGPTERTVRATLQEFAGLGGLPTGSTAPWADAAIRAPEQAAAALTTVSVLAREVLPAAQRSIMSLAEPCHLRAPTTVQEGAELLAAVEGAHSTADLFRSEIYEQDLELLAEFIGRRGLGSLTSSEVRRARRTATSLLCAPKQKLERDALTAAIVRARDVQSYWTAWTTTPDPPVVPPVDLVSIRAQWDALESSLAALATFVPTRELRLMLLSALKPLLEAMIADRAQLQRLPQAHRCWDQLHEDGLDGVLDAAMAAGIAIVDLPDAFSYCWCSSIYEAELLRDPAVGALDAEYHGRIVREFRQADADHIDRTPQRIRRAVAERIVLARDAYPQQGELVAREAGKQRRHIPLRKLFKDAPDVLRALKPCWVMSPLEVSQLLPGDQPYFDVVIFDEASQVTPADAVPAILRGRRLVVAGDQQQLPPTNFFLGATPDDDSDDEYDTFGEVGTANFQSILDAVTTFVPFRSLGWHYRSRDERLIAYSNVYFYDRSLLTFPGALGADCLKYARVPAPTPGLDANRSAVAEVDRVVAEIIEHIHTNPSESLGVIALGIQHANRISEALRLARLGDPTIEWFFSEEQEDPFFVKNLERVQGDERDAIILSIGYGKRNADGRLSYQFGPLIQESGERRLNVAVTRARNRMTVVSSFGAEDMDPARTTARGADLLRRYLQYVASGGEDLGSGPRENPKLNPFEISVRDALTAAGVPVIAQYGTCGYSIDFVAQHPDEPGRFVLAIECDGASYHSQPTSRDRDRLRQEQLERLGWHFHRIWSTDWFADPAKETESVLRAYEQAVTDDHGESTIPDRTLDDAAPAPVPEPPTAPHANITPGRRAARPPVPRGLGSIDLYSNADLIALIDWIESDTLLRTENQLLREAMNELGFRRQGSKIDARLRRSISTARKRRP